MSSGYEKIYQNILPLLAAADLPKQALTMGLRPLADGTVPVTFLTRDYLITPEGVAPVDGGQVNINTLSVLAYYLLSSGHGEPSPHYLPMENLTGMVKSQKAHAQSLMVKPLLTTFGNDYASFCENAIRLKGSYEGCAPCGGHCWLFLILPKIPVKIIFHEADAEFQADIRVLYPANAVVFFEFECLAFMHGCFCDALMAKPKK